MDKEWIESSPGEKDWGVLVEKNWNMNRQYLLAAQNASCTLGYIIGIAASRSRKVMLPLMLS